jgi:hypothetical protein
MERMALLFKTLSQDKVRGCFEDWKARMERDAASDKNYYTGDNT